MHAIFFAWKYIPWELRIEIAFFFQIVIYWYTFCCNSDDVHLAPVNFEIKPLKMKTTAVTTITLRHTDVVVAFEIDIAKFYCESMSMYCENSTKITNFLKKILCKRVLEKNSEQLYEKQNVVHQLLMQSKRLKVSQSLKIVFDCLIQISNVQLTWLTEFHDVCILVVVLTVFSFYDFCI